MKIDREKKGLVRGVVKVVEDRGTDTLTAYTFWYRHDEPNLEQKLESDTKRLLRAYEHMKRGWSSAGIELEWKPYRDKSSLYY